MNGNMNNALQSIIQMKNAGKNPQVILNMLMQQNPQLSQMMAQFQNMSQGRSPREFIAQLARQNGVSEQNMAQIMSIFH